jgi:DNA-binding HxlR family transcriptional regulator
MYHFQNCKSFGYILEMRQSHRSLCPVSLALDVFGDRWTLLIIRDMMFADKRHFSEFLTAEERISLRILTDRLNRLLYQGIITKGENPAHKQKAIYSLTDRGIALLPVITQMGIWGRSCGPVTKESAAMAARLERGGPKLRKKLMTELRKKHLGQKKIRL